MTQTPEQAAREMLDEAQQHIAHGDVRRTLVIFASHLTAFRDGAETAPKALRDAAQRVVDERFDTFKAGNGRKIGVQDDSGEKCWIVPFDPMFDLEKALNDPTSATLSAIPADEREAVEHVGRLWVLRSPNSRFSDALRRFLARLGAGSG